MLTLEHDGKRGYWGNLSRDVCYEILKNKPEKSFIIVDRLIQGDGDRSYYIQLQNGKEIEIKYANKVTFSPEITTKFIHRIHPIESRRGEQMMYEIQNFEHEDFGFYFEQMHKQLEKKNADLSKWENKNLIYNTKMFGTGGIVDLFRDLHIIKKSNPYDSTKLNKCKLIVELKRKRLLQKLRQ
jgi:hypothetical protein